MSESDWYVKRARRQDPGKYVVWQAGMIIAYCRTEEAAHLIVESVNIYANGKIPADQMGQIVSVRMRPRRLEQSR